MRQPAPPRPAAGRLDRVGAGRPTAGRTPSDAPETGARLSVRPAARRPVAVEHSPGASARLDERAAMRRHLHRQRVTGALATAVVVLGAGWGLFYSGLLALDTAHVTLTGAGSVVDPAEVHAVVAGHEGTPLPRLDTVGLRRELLDVPGVRAVEVSRAWPHGLQVTVVSREPVAAVQSASGGFTLLDVEAVPVGRVDESPAGLPVVVVPADDPGARAALAVLTVLQGLPDDLVAQVTGASAGSQDTVRLTLADGAQVEWGSADEIALKVRVLAALRTAEVSRGAAVYDVSAPTMPITRS